MTARSGYCPHAGKKPWSGERRRIVDVQYHETGGSWNGHRHRRCRLFRHRSGHSPLAPGRLRAAARPSAHRAHRSARGDRRGRGLRNARLPVSAQRRHRADVARQREPRRFPRLCARRRAFTPSPGDYLPRQVYGDYLRARFAEACAGAPAGVECVHHRARALQLRRGGDGRWFLWLDDGSAVRADDVVLALGNPPPASLPELAPLAGDERVIARSVEHRLPAHRDIGSVLLVGSGLTMIDAALRLAAMRPRVRHIHVLSRHGWLPQPQATATSPADTARRGGCARQRRADRRVDCSGRCATWREPCTPPTVTGAKCSHWCARHLPTLWRSLDHAQRARFLRHVRALWDVHRHRVPAGALGAVRTLERARSARGACRPARRSECSRRGGSR